jgi:hypothetical protein
MFFKARNSVSYVKLVRTPLFRELTEVEKMQDNPHSLQELKRIFEDKLPTFQD